MRLSLDIETYSSVDLAKSGVYRYAEAPDFRILLIGYAWDEGPVRVIDLENGEDVPEEILEALLSEEVEKWAFNAAFERVCLSRFLRDRGKCSSGFLPARSWRCSMVWSAYLGLPMSLAGVGKVLGLEKQKLESGKRLIRYFCKGRDDKVNAMGDSQGLGHYGLLRSLDYARDDTMNAADNSCTGARLRNLDSDKWREFVEYNRRDVETEREIRQRLSRYPVPENVWAEYETDQAINDRGIRADRAFVCAALEMDRESREQLTAELARRTEILRPNSVPQIREWLNAHGQACEGLSKAEVRDMMKDAEPEVREVLLLRQQLARTSVRKYAAMANAVCADGRIRGMFQFYGASRSGRWAGRNVQLQNLPQNHLEDLDGARKLVLRKDHDAIRMLHGPVPDVLSELIRTAFVPEDGKKFIVCDFAAIEARVIAWLAGENWRQEVFRDGGDIYCASASAMFRVPVEKHGVNGHLRQKGKIAELALGYGGSTGALRAMGATEMGIQEEELQPLVDAWRNSNPNIVQLWRNVDLAVKTAVGEGRTVEIPISEPLLPFGHLSAASIGATVHRTDRLFQLTSAPTRIPPPAVVEASPLKGTA